VAGTSTVRRALITPAAVACALLTVLAVLALPGRAAAAQSAGAPPMIGYNDDFNNFELHTSNPLDPLTGGIPGFPDLPFPGDTTEVEANGKELLDLARKGGADVVRYTVPWARVERKQGTYDWSIEDATYHMTLDDGLRPVIILHTAPCWAYPSVECGGDGDYRAYRPDPEYLDEFANFARAAIERYPKAAGFEIWNEPNLKAFWGPDGTPEAYATMVKAVGQRLEGMGPHPPVLFAGLTPKPKWVEYLKSSLGTYGARAYVDGTAIHPYVGDKGVSAVRKRIRDVQDALRAVKAPRPIWITEVGWSTSPDAETGVTEAEQAARVDQLIKVAPQLKVKAVIIHRLRDIENSSAWEEGLGVLDIDSHPKPIYCALGLNYGEHVNPPGCG
jgi:hypothetical protein